MNLKMHNGVAKTSTGHEIQIKDLNDLDSDGKSFILIKLPKELIEYRKNGGDLKLSLKSLKSGCKFKVDNLEYEASVYKSKNISFNSTEALFSEGDSIKKMGYKYVVEIRRALEMPEFAAPLAIEKTVQVSQSILDYAKKRTISMTSESARPIKKRKK